MHTQVCPFCKKEFMPRHDGKSHTYCSRKCALDHDDLKAHRSRLRKNNQNIPETTWISDHKKD
jgi:endogenous inhibitor of DNA gyrase (YacG/DUF329 family)